MPIGRAAPWSRSPASWTKRERSAADHDHAGLAAGAVSWYPLPQRRQRVGIGRVELGGSAMRYSTIGQVVWLPLVLALTFSACRAPTAPGSAAPSGAAAPAEGAAPAAPAAQSAPEAIVIGAALPLTGQESRAGGYFKTAYEMAADEVNADGGILVAEYNKKIPVRLVIQDDQTDQNLSRNLYERLATVDKVNFFLGGYSTGLGVAHAPVADQYKIPYVTGGEAAVVGREPGHVDHGVDQVLAGPGPACQAGQDRPALGEHQPRQGLPARRAELRQGEP